MRKRYAAQNLLFISAAVVLFAITSCKKDRTTTNNNTPVTATPTKLGLYEEAQTDNDTVYREVFITVTQIGTLTVPDSLSDQVFDTGSGGMVIDAHYILPANMITSTGFNFTGDSTVVDGITITNQKHIIQYGDDNNSTATVSGNLCYASVTIGVTNGNIVVKRLPFYMYYKSVDNNGKALPPHEFDVFGANSGYDVTFPNNAFITSPFSYFDPGTGLTKGFKMAALGTANFSDQNEVPLTPDVITLGLTADDLSSASGFSMSQLTESPPYGYQPYIPATITYNGTIVNDASILFDTGTNADNYLEDPSLNSRNAVVLPTNAAVSVSTTSGFKYAYTVGKLDNLTYVENPQYSGVPVSIFSLNFFFDNEYMLDFTDHKLGVKSN
ncbi:hypothetical protein SAMN05216490_3850 [Mucilaginibacter mallensis]|uniref:Aspartyl protease n=1 Tax=Mucilaginibacter mallensis TaxID=652787 RepID=A0A1H2B1C9_MUCMA|nr:hypothetical protein [Mucilaginibacter mallensis]SDT51974.1 hypothetical protein SAMN05216490_3850 [Mucilaginibacter mallensis]